MNDRIIELRDSLLYPVIWVFKSIREKYLHLRSDLSGSPKPLFISLFFTQRFRVIVEISHIRE